MNNKQHTTHTSTQIPQNRVLRASVTTNSLNESITTPEKKMPQNGSKNVYIVTCCKCWRYASVLAKNNKYYCVKHLPARFRK